MVFVHGFNSIKDAAWGEFPSLVNDDPGLFLSLLPTLSREEWLDDWCVSVWQKYGRCSTRVAIRSRSRVWGQNEAAAIAAFEVFSVTVRRDETQARGRTVRIRMIDQLRALELYGKAMGYFGDRRDLPSYEATARSITVEFVEPQTNYLGAALSRSS